VRAEDFDRRGGRSGASVEEEVVVVVVVVGGVGRAISIPVCILLSRRVVELKSEICVLKFHNTDALRLRRPWLSLKINKAVVTLFGHSQ